MRRGGWVRRERRWGDGGALRVGRTVWLMVMGMGHGPVADERMARGHGNGLGWELAKGFVFLGMELARAWLTKQKRSDWHVGEIYVVLGADVML